MEVKKWVSLLFISFLSLPITGCWDYNKINERAPIIGIAADPVKGDDNKISFTFQVQRFTPSGGGKGGGGGGGTEAQLPTNYVNFHVVSTDLHTALASAQTLSIKKFYLGDFNLLLINRHLKAPQVAKVVLEFIRDTSSDRLAYLFCADKSALDILSLTGTHESPSDAIHDQLDAKAMQKAYFTRTKVWEFWRDIHRIGIEPKVGIIKVKGSTFDVAGMEAFSSYQPKYKLNRWDSVFFHLLNDHLHEMAFQIPDRGKNFEVHHIHTTSHIKVLHQKGKTILYDHIIVNGVLSNDEIDNQTNLSNRELSRYEQVMGKYLKNQSEKVLKKLQQQKLDIFGFGQYEVIQHPERLEDIQKNWPDTFSSALPLIKMDVHIHHTGTLM